MAESYQPAVGDRQSKGDHPPSVLVAPPESVLLPGFFILFYFFFLSGFDFFCFSIFAFRSITTKMYVLLATQIGPKRNARSVPFHPSCGLRISIHLPAPSADITPSTSIPTPVKRRSGTGNRRTCGKRKERRTWRQRVRKRRIKAQKSKRTRKV